MGSASATQFSPATCAARTAAARTNKFWLWPNLLSLDAPVVAVLWQLLFLRCFHAPVNALTVTLLALTVWLIYSADRAMDAFAGERRTPRHRFYRDNWRVLLPLWTALFGFAAWVSITRLPAPELRSGLMLLGGVALYFVVVHYAWGWVKKAWPKEATVGVLFALGASLGAWQKIHTVADAATVLLFSCLCWMNCAAIETWEREKWEGERWPSVSVGARAQWPLSVMALVVVALALAVFFEQRPVLAGAEIASALAFLLLHRSRGRLSADALRVLADVVLLSPLLFLPLAGSV